LLRSIAGVTPMLNRVARHRVNRDRDQPTRGRISRSPATEVSNYTKGAFYRVEIENCEGDDCVLVYRKDGTANTKEPLSFLKDWVTSVIQLETGALAVFGLAAGFKEAIPSAEPAHQSVGSPVLCSLCSAFATWSPIIELILIVLSGVLFLKSISRGLDVLNALPGAAQRLPANATARQSDIFSIRNEDTHPSIYQRVDPFRRWFIWGAWFFAAFILVRLLEQINLVRLLEQINRMMAG